MRIELRKYILLSFVLLVSWSAKSQLTSTAANSREDITFGSGKSSVLSTNFYYQLISVATVTGANPKPTAIKSWWTQYDTLTNTFSLPIQTTFNDSSTLAKVDAGAGYQFSSTDGVDTIRYYCWTFEPKITLDSVFVDRDSLVTNCSMIGLQAKTTTKPLFYRNPLNTTALIPVDYKLTYSWTSTPKDTTIENVWNPKFIQPIDTSIYAVVVNGLDLPTLTDSTSSPYIATGLRAGIKLIPVNKPNENERENTEGDSIIGSGPFKVLFKNISKGEHTKAQVIIYLKDQEKYIYNEPYEETRPYTFSMAKTYYVEMQIQNSKTSCTSVSDRTEVVIPESMLGIPNCFTPDGDGVNEKFMITYTSLKSYQIYIYNRWGRRVFQSDNPGDGWDGTADFGAAAEGVYFYVITAIDLNGNVMTYKVGGENKPTKGTITLLRPAK